MESGTIYYLKDTFAGLFYLFILSLFLFFKGKNANKRFTTGMGPDLFKIIRICFKPASPEIVSSSHLLTQNRIH